MKLKWLIVLLPAGLLLLLAGCRQQNNNKGKPEITPRNLAINSSNAYNNLFLDSAAVEKYIAAQNPGDTIANAMRSFYNARNFEYAWFDELGLTEQARGFRSLYHYSKDTTEGTRRLETRQDALMNDDDSTVNPHDPGIVKTELQLTQRFIQYALNKYDDISTSQLEQFIPIRKQPVLQLADSVLAIDSREHEQYKADNPGYAAMEKQLEKYTGIAKKGGWPAVTADKKKYRKGDSAPAIQLVKKRLQITGELAGADTTALFNDTLEAAVKSFQQNHGYTPTGIITDTIIQDMNVPALTRVQQLLINMERMRWAPGRPEGQLIIVNIPEYMLHVWDGNKKVFDMEVVVGKEGSSTTQFSGDLNQVVFNPYWHVPRSIVRKEILPAMEKNKHYLEENDMEITGERNGLPVVRQLPGKKNALGHVKFLFPNSFNIYFHDTPAKWLFEKDKRAYSHGCIRLSDPLKMANYLLQDMPEWTPEKIDSAFNKGDKEKYVRIKHAVPVLVTYYTAWVDEHNTLQFREDIYGHDARLAEKMFTDAKMIAAAK
ncbi:MAG TPA: L,D-transpeptidase family protein [Chitinophaga sp.]|uniref:L,D-transpeptidase family protein n=1 Tax=Chitinophaga sp. TaxID=1869181 RepID=UPI002DB922AB|nr:L,D-transpeptidase family protein [Chitinophaga sp.]HEU4554773.1 L,D-transpeptidase family protein [Chitinophaga sp.]